MDQNKQATPEKNAQGEKAPQDLKTSGQNPENKDAKQGQEKQAEKATS